MGIAIAIAAVFLSVNAFESASAQQLVLDGISPQSDGTSPNSYAIGSSLYGLGFIAGDNRELSAIEILVNAAVPAGEIEGYLYQNSNNGNSGTGTYIATFTQPATATSYVGSVTNSYLPKCRWHFFYI